MNWRLLYVLSMLRELFTEMLNVGLMIPCYFIPLLKEIGSNVMVDEDGEIQLIDFGVAGIVMTTMPEDKRKTVIGTPHWMPPELQWDKPEISHGTEVDVWAYGITLYECAMGQPPNANITNPRQLRTVIRKNPVRLTDERFTPELRDLIQFVLEPDAAKRPTMEQVCQHPYIVGTKAAHPVRILQELVQQYLQWESQGGIRHSLWMAGGAEKVDTNQIHTGQKQDPDDGWNFSTTEAFRRRMSQIDPSFNYPYDPFSPTIPEEPTLSNSPPPPDDDDEVEERWTTRFDTKENQKSKSDDEPRADSSKTFQGTASAERGGKHLMNLFDRKAPEYQYNYGKASDLPLRHGGEASLHRQELSVSSNDGGGPTINLEDVSNKKRATMAWTWNEGLNTGPPVETSNRDSDFFADLPTGQRETSRQSDFFGDLAPPRPGLGRAATMPVTNPTSDNRASTLDLDALLGTSDYNMPSVSNANSFVSHPSTNHSFDFPTTSQFTSYGGTTLGSFSNTYMEEPLDSFEADMSATTTDINNFTMRPATYHERDRRGHAASTSQLPADLVSSPAGSSFDDIARDLPSGTSQFANSFDLSQVGHGEGNGIAGWQSRLGQPGWMNGEVLNESFASSATLANGSTAFTGGAGSSIPYVTRCQAARPPVLAFPEALDTRASPALLGQALQFQIQQAMGLLDSLNEQINIACDEELAHIDRVHGSEDESDSDEEDDEEDAGYEGGQEYADGTEAEDGGGFVTENDAESGTATGEESSRSA